ncbi:MAG: membrane protein insertase YidC [Candidatus Pacebacteria bacterium]|nr:membrane protein insertase YidC [Candidatus Paceibacterota bacterium]
MYNELIFRPLYNGLVGIMDLVPWIDVGIAVIIFTVIVKLILYPLSKSSLLTQVKMKEVEPDAAKIRAQYSSDKQTQALKIMELYKSRGVKPFAGILLVLIQLPILFAIISVFYKIIPEIRPEYLYSFVSIPVVKTHFLGLIDLTQKSLILSLITAGIQYFQLKYSLASRPTAPSDASDTASQISNSMNKQMKYLLPILAFASTYWLIPAQFPQAAAIIAVYWSVSTLFTLGQELYIRKKHIK